MATSSKSLNPAVVLGLMAVVFLVAGVVLVSVGIHVRQAIAEGENGTFTPQVQQCREVSSTDSEGRTRKRDECAWKGQFRGPDTTVDDIRLGNDLNTDRGDPAPGPVDAVLTNDGSVYLPGVAGWGVFFFLGGPFALVGLTLTIITVVMLLRKNRRTPVADTPVQGIYRP